MVTLKQAKGKLTKQSKNWGKERRRKKAAYPGLAEESEDEGRRRGRLRLEGDAIGDRSEWHEDKEDFGAICSPEGLEDSAQGFNPGKRPPGRRALKGRQIRRISQIRRIRNRRQEHV
jgi:hypothetical protein